MYCSTFSSEMDLRFCFVETPEWMFIVAKLLSVRLNSKDEAKRYKTIQNLKSLFTYSTALKLVE